jgi:putative ABC transport system ATP-binding protein
MDYLCAEKLVKEYERRGKTFRAVDDVDIQIREGEFIIITGESGSGKTTLLNLLLGLTKPASGSVRFEGEDINSFDDRRLSEIRNEKIKYIPQGDSLLSSLTVRENILFPFVIGGKEKPSDERLYELSDRLGITDLLDEYPSELSGGEMRRATIARAIINKPAVIIADEPTGNLDRDNTSKVMEIFKDISGEGTAVVVVTHQRETLGYASKIFGMSHGKLTPENK